MSAIHAPIALTPGEPAGIGPDLVIQLAAAGQLPPEVVVIADPELLAARAKGLNLPFTPRDWQTRLDTPPYDPAATWVAPVPLRATAQPGCLNPDNADYVLETLTRATRGCLSGEFGALVTGPVHKGVINDSGVPFSGHTEFLAELCGGMTPVMMLATERLRVALVTTHLPLRAVPDAITPPALETVIRILHRDLQQRFRIPAPRILVCGLNPHAGEGGHLGREEIDVIVPILDVLRGEGMDLRGPLPADTAFTPASLAHGDVVLAMYHDQGLPVLKHDGFGAAVNVTLGLPIVRTSVDHGTALDLAATGRAGTGSLLTALRLAQQLAV